MASNTDPTNGESPLAEAPVYGGRGGGDQAAAYYAYQDFKNQFGRAPTQSELSMLTPSYVGGDPNVANLSAGKGGVAAYYNSLTNTPTNIAANQQKQALDAYNKNKDQYNGQINQVFQGSVGREASADEANHFGALLASGQIDQYGLSQLLGQSQEAQQRQTQNYQDTLSKNLQSTQGDYFKNYINPAILSQTAAAGRDPNSSGVQNAEVQAGKQQNYDLQNYLANFGASQYGQSAQNQQNVYQQYLGQQYGLQNAGISQQLGQQAYMQQNNTNLQNYQLQQQAYNNYLNNYGNRSNALAIAGTVLGGVQTGMNLYSLGKGTQAANNSMAYQSAGQSGSGLGQNLNLYGNGSGYNRYGNKSYTI